MPMYYGGFGMSWLMMILMMLVPLALIGLVVYWAVYSGFRRALKKPDQAMEILKQRYVRNEISREEYNRMKEEIAG